MQGLDKGLSLDMNQPTNKPTLHLVIAEDDPYCYERYERFFRRAIEVSRLYKAGEFLLDSYVCTTLVAFDNKVEHLVETGDPVYATLDLKMPRKDGERPVDISRELMSRCFRYKKEKPRVKSPFDFCLISGAENILQRLIKDPELGPKLQHWGVNHVYKNKIGEEGEGDAELWKITADIKQFILKAIRFCTVPLEVTPGKPAQTRVIWFGEHLTHYLSLADSIAGDPLGGVYLLFSDAAGYEKDWFHLCCRLKEVKPRFLDLSRVDPGYTDWTARIVDPPAALLITGIEHIDPSGLDLAQELTGHDFFAKVTQGKKLAFLHFPFGDSHLSLTRRLPGLGEAALDLCLKQVYGEEGPRETGVNFPIPQHPKIIPFPTFEELKTAEVPKKTIQVLARECQQDDRTSVELDPELLGVLVELPWDRLGGVAQLQRSVILAFQGYRGGKGYLTIDDFKDVGIRREFNGPHGFLVRGRLLYELLEENNAAAEPWALDTQTRRRVDPKTDLGGLLTILDLFTRLGRLVRLGKRLEQEERNLPASEGFSTNYFHALEAAYAFLKLIFKDEARLGRQIQEYRAHASSRHHYYPSLREREDWADLVDKIKFKWPFDQLPLHFSVYVYLERSDVIAEIHTDPIKILSRHEDLQEDWAAVERERRAIQEKLQKREGQRRAARRHILSSHTQPANVHLNPANEAGDFNYPLQAFLLFNAHLAVCENHYRHGDEVLEADNVRKFLDRGEHGYCINIFRQYLRNLGPRPSVFGRWREDWAERGGQDDCLRLLRSLAGGIFGKYGNLFGDQEIATLERLAGLEGDCDVVDLLGFFNSLRLAFERKTVATFWNTHGRTVLEVFRRLIVATTAERLRFGRVSEDGERIDLWSGEGLEATPSAGGKSENHGRLCLVTGTKPVHLFPIDDLIRINPETASVWAYDAKKKWANLSYEDSLEETAEHSKAYPKVGHPFLPDWKIFTKSRIWISVYG